MIISFDAVMMMRPTKWEKDHGILDLVFSGRLLEAWTKKDIEEYMKGLMQIRIALPKRYLYAHSTLQKSIGRYFHLLGWHYDFEVPSGDLYSSDRYDLMAQKDSKTVVVETKPEVTVRDLGQVLGYIFNVKRMFNESRVFLGTDILNLDILFRASEVRVIIFDNARKNGLGVILANKNQAWLIPAEFLTI